MLDYNKKFLEDYNRLNPEQKQAVDAIDGPLMVVAGPGTGKTQILALRICNILRTTDTQAHNVLCLTYTDAGSIAMRQRLTDFMGPDAYNVHIYTFHAFCNQVIQENLHLFGGVRDLQPLTDLESVELYEELIDNIPADSILKRFKGDPYYERWRMRPLFDTMKKEDWDAQMLISHADKWVDDEIELNPDYKYKRKSTAKGVTYQKGELKPAKVQELKKRMDTFKAAVLQYKNYQKLLKQKQRYDYNDMILWVIRTFNTHESLLLQYQERYLYFLVDEFQDTNGSQNDVLNLLVDYWDNPNVFVVGDDDQSIYRFQGASMQNILGFEKKYSSQMVALKHNYRSNQEILDASSNLIRHNEERLVSLIPSLDKTLIASNPEASDLIKPNILEFQNTAQEEAWLYDILLQAHTNKENLDGIAVIYRNHKQVTNLVKALESSSVPLNLKRKINILEIPFINQLLFALEYVQMEYEQAGSGELSLFKLMHLPFLNIAYSDMFKISRACVYDKNTDKKINWSEVISDKEMMKKVGVKDIDKIYSLYQNLSNWIKDLPNYTLQNLFEHIITDLNVMDYILSAKDMHWLLQLLTTFFDFMKNESTKNPSITLKIFLSTIQKMKDNNIVLAFNRILSAENGVHFITAHSSKGLQFDKVFILGATKNQWESKRNPSSNYTFPGNLLDTSDVNKEEEERRLFYVAMTRTRFNLNICYSHANAENNNKALEPSRFVLELKETDNVKNKTISVDDTKVLMYRAKTMTTTTLPDKGMVDSELVNQVMENFQLSVTSLNKYLKCPITFYYETILRVPFARSANAGFGSAIHYALEALFQEKEKSDDGSFGGEKLLLSFFDKGMMRYRSHFTDKEFKRLLEYGHIILARFHKKYIDSWHLPNKNQIEYSIKNVHFKNVPLTGILDRVEDFKDYINVIDYKTGKPENAKKKMKPPKNSEDIGGDYWRQIVFYRLLVDIDPMNNWNMTSGEMVLVEPDKNDEFQKYKIVVGPADIQIVGDQITETYAQIRNHEFSEGCNDDRCQWCNFVKDHVPVQGFLDEEIED